MTRPIVITGGGTGGHVFPMRAIADQLVEAGVAPGDLRFVGSRRGQERQLLGGGASALTLLGGRGIRRAWTPEALWANLGAVAGLVGGVLEALVLVARWRPSVVVSVGGYASFATSLAAVVWRRPLVLVEPDATPGAVHRILSRFASVRCTAVDVDEPRCVTTGAPLRESILAVDRSAPARTAARAGLEPPVAPGRGVVVVMTGSLGATRVNQAVCELAAAWTDRADRTLIHVTGRRDVDAVRAARPATGALDYRILDFADMATLWAVADAAVCRAGATTIAELCALGIPSVVVPLPGMGDHQDRNARALVAAGGARRLADAECTAGALAELLDAIMEPTTLESMSVAAAALGRRDAAKVIARVVLESRRSS